MDAFSAEATKVLRGYNTAPLVSSTPVVTNEKRKPFLTSFFVAEREGFYTTLPTSVTR